MSTKSKARKYIEKLNDGPVIFGQYVEAHRLCDDLSQTDLARRMRVSRAYLCDVEKGRRLVSVERAADFAKALGYPVGPFVEAALDDQLRKAGLKMRVSLNAA